MAHYAKVKNGIVTKVIVAEQDFIDNYKDNEAGVWVQTSYNTYGGQHKLGGTPLRKNFATTGYIYDKLKDAFYAPQPFPSWTLNEDTCLWEAPTTKPDDGKRYIWNEETTSWDLDE
jgi:hypothetical protein